MFDKTIKPKLPFAESALTILYWKKYSLPYAIDGRRLSNAPIFASKSRIFASKTAFFGDTWWFFAMDYSVTVFSTSR